MLQEKRLKHEDLINNVGLITCTVITRASSIAWRAGGADRRSRKTTPNALVCGFNYGTRISPGSDPTLLGRVPQR